MALSNLVSRGRRMAWTGNALAAALLLQGGCGGGDLVEPFAPTRQLSFGDDSSVLTASGRNFGVNGLNATSGVFDCTVHPNWVQYLGSRFGFVFAQCNPNAVAAPQARMLAAAGAKVADVLAQVQAHLAGDRFGPQDMVTVLAGANDILEQYALFPGLAEKALVEELQRRGQALAQQVNAIAALDGRIIVATVPDLRWSPFAVAEEAANPGRAALLGRLTEAFNTRMRISLDNNGRRIGIVLADDLVQDAVRDPSFLGFVNVNQAVCTTAPPDCTTATLITGGSGSTWLWADPTRLSAGGQLGLGARAESIARRNPF